MTTLKIITVGLMYNNINANYRNKSKLVIIISIIISTTVKPATNPTINNKV